MTEIELIKYYCFNNKCSNSIFNHESCKVTELPFTDAIYGSVTCKHCNTQMISGSIINMNRQIQQLLEYNIPQYHHPSEAPKPSHGTNLKLQSLDHIMNEINTDFNIYKKLKSDFNSLCNNLKAIHKKRQAILEKIVY